MDCHRRCNGAVHTRSRVPRTTFAGPIPPSALREMDRTRRTVVRRAFAVREPRPPERAPAPGPSAYRRGERAMACRW